MRKKKQHRRRARRTLLSALAWFGIGQLLLTAAIDCFALAVRDPEFAAKAAALETQLLAHPGRPLMLALGSSRTRLALRAGQVAEDSRGEPVVCFNFGIPGAGPTMQLVCLRRLLARGICPRMVYVEVLPALFSECDRRPMEDAMIDASRLTAAEMLWTWTYFSNRSKALRTWLAAACLPVRAHQAGLQALHEIHPTRYFGDAYGWHPEIAEVNAAQRARLTEMAANQYRGALAHPRLAQGKQQALVDLLWICRQQQIEAVLVLMPESDGFRKLYEPRAAEQFDRFLDQITDLFETPLVDARRWLDEEHFFDGHHTLPHGATAFTGRLADVLRPVKHTARGGRSRRAMR
jgi:hypothetical protein